MLDMLFDYYAAACYDCCNEWQGKKCSPSAKHRIFDKEMRQRHTRRQKKTLLFAVSHIATPKKGASEKKKTNWKKEIIISCKRLRVSSIKIRIEYWVCVSFIFATTIHRIFGLFSGSITLCINMCKMWFYLCLCKIFYLFDFLTMFGYVFAYKCSVCVYVCLRNIWITSKANPLVIQQHIQKKWGMLASLTSFTLFRRENKFNYELNAKTMIKIMKKCNNNNHLNCKSCEGDKRQTEDSYKLTVGIESEEEKKNHHSVNIIYGNSNECCCVYKWEWVEKWSAVSGGNFVFFF